jgi:hypothetical protein
MRNILVSGVASLSGNATAWHATSPEQAATTATSVVVVVVCSNLKHHNTIGDMMDKIIELAPSDLVELFGEMGLAGIPGKVYKLRVCSDGNWVKFKVNESTWSAPLGHLDPKCRAAARQRRVASPKERDGEA